jgi:hypothetical protein
MERKLIQLAVSLSLAALAMSAMAQTTVTTSGTTSSSTVPVFNGTATVTNSPITVSGSNVGIGTTTPLAPLNEGTRDSISELRAVQLSVVRSIDSVTNDLGISDVTWSGRGLDES